MGAGTPADAGVAPAPQPSPTRHTGTSVGDAAAATSDLVGDVQTKPDGRRITYYRRALPEHSSGATSPDVGAA